MLRFDKAITFSPNLKYSLLTSFDSRICSLRVLPFVEFINIVSIFYTLIDLVILLYIVLVIYLD